MSGKDHEKINVFEKNKTLYFKLFHWTRKIQLWQPCCKDVGKTHKNIRSMSESDSEKFFFPKHFVSKCSDGYFECTLSTPAEKKFVEYPKLMKVNLSSRKKT